MARVMSASDERNSKGTRVVSRILVLTDSMRPLARPRSIAARMKDSCLTSRCARPHARRDLPAARPPDPDPERLDCLVVRSRKDESEAFLEELGAIQPDLVRKSREPSRCRRLAAGHVSVLSLRVFSEFHAALT